MAELFLALKWTAIVVACLAAAPFILGILYAIFALFFSIAVVSFGALLLGCVTIYVWLRELWRKLWR